MSNKNAATCNACKLCSPLGACLALKGIEGAISFLHGGQGCATYIRRYLISHFREPVDIASSNFGEQSVIFGGEANFKEGLSNVISRYQPQVIGIPTTCLVETIGDDVEMHLSSFRKSGAAGSCTLFNISTPSYRGTHVEGFRIAVRETVRAVAQRGDPWAGINLFAPIVSPADLRLLKELCAAFELPFMLLPDYSETLDGESWSEYHKTAPGGTPLAQVKKSANAKASVALGRDMASGSAAQFLESEFGVKHFPLTLPIGIDATDRFLRILSMISGNTVPVALKKERGRLIDAYIDAHKYLFGQRAIVYGEEDLVIAIATFLSEIGVIPILLATGGKSGQMQQRYLQNVRHPDPRTTILEGADFMEIAELAETLKPDLLIGNSKGYSIARKLDIPLIRVGFPIHDRVGAQRIQTLGYRGTQELFDRITNAVIKRQQESSPVGYTYI